LKGLTSTFTIYDVEIEIFSTSFSL